MAQHTPLQCVWRQWLRPLLYTDGSRLLMDVEPEEVDGDMYRVLLDFACDNAEDFMAWLKQDHAWLGQYRYRKGADGAVQKWMDYSRKHSLTCPGVGPVLQALLFGVPCVLLGIVLAAAATGVATWLHIL